MQDKPYKSVLIVGCGYIGRRVATLVDEGQAEASRAPYQRRDQVGLVVFQEEGATNVKWVWAPSREDCKGCEPNYRYESFYPGNRYVDYVALNSYNSAKRRWRTLDRPRRSSASPRR